MCGHNVQKTTHPVKITPSVRKQSAAVLVSALIETRRILPVRFRASTHENHSLQWVSFYGGNVAHVRSGVAFHHEKSDHFDSSLMPNLHAASWPSWGEIVWPGLLR